MAHEQQLFGMCQVCLGHGALVRTSITIENGRRVMRLDNRPCAACDGLGFLRGTGSATDTEETEDDEELGPEDWPT
jgi:hypothetical protein